MKANVLWPIAVIVALVVGYAWRGEPKPRDAPPRRGMSKAVNARLAAMATRIDTLEETVERLSARPDPQSVADPDRALGIASTAPARRSRAAADSDPAPTPGGAAAVAAALKSNDPAVRGELRKIIAKERAAAREARFDRFAERASERTRQMVSDLADQADLSDDQQALVQGRLDAERTLVMGLFRAAREDGSFPEARREAEAIRDATDAQIKAKLDDAQYAQYLELRDENRWGPPRRDRRKDR